MNGFRPISWVCIESWELCKVSLFGGCSMLIVVLQVGNCHCCSNLESIPREPLHSPNIRLVVLYSLFLLRRCHTSICGIRTVRIACIQLDLSVLVSSLYITFRPFPLLVSIRTEWVWI